MVINKKNVKEENGVYVFKMHSMALAKHLIVSEDCTEASQSVNVLHTGSDIKLESCDYDGSAYIITNKWGILNGDMTLCSVVFMSNGLVLMSVDNGFIWYEDENGDVFYLGNDGTRGPATEGQRESIHWFTSAQLIKTLPYHLKRWTNQYDEIIMKQMANLVFSYLFKADVNMSSYKICGVDDSLTAPHGFRYTQFEELDFNNEDDEVVDVEDDKDDENEDNYEDITEEDIDDDFDDNEYVEEDYE